MVNMDDNKPSSKWINIPKEHINFDLKLGETIIVSNNSISKTVCFRHKRKNFMSFLEPQDYLEYMKLNSVKRKHIHASNLQDPFYIKFITNKEQTQCQNPDCQYKHVNFEHYMLDYDHIVKSAKTNDISDLIVQFLRVKSQSSKNKWISLITEELKNCQLLCKLCHTKKIHIEKSGDHLYNQSYDSLDKHLANKNLSSTPKATIVVNDIIL